MPIQPTFGWEIAESKVRFNVGVGIFISYLLNSDSEREILGFYDRTGERFPNTYYKLLLPFLNRNDTDKLNKVGLGATGMVGISYTFGQRGLFSLEWNGKYGFSRLYKNDDNTTKTYSSGVMLGYSFLL